MERLTYRTEAGDVKIKGNVFSKEESTIKDDCSRILKCFDKLAAYEDTGMTPEDIMSIINGCAGLYGFPDERITLFGKTLDHWFRLYEAEVNGLLLRLPCKIGDPVWSSVFTAFDNDGNDIPMKWPFSVSMLTEWGTGWFATREEAEAALAEMKERKNA